MLQFHYSRKTRPQGSIAAASYGDGFGYSDLQKRYVEVYDHDAFVRDTPPDFVHQSVWVPARADGAQTLERWPVATGSGSTGMLHVTVGGRFSVRLAAEMYTRIPAEEQEAALRELLPRMAPHLKAFVEAHPVAARPVDTGPLVDPAKRAELSGRLAEIDQRQRIAPAELQLFRQILQRLEQALAWSPAEIAANAEGFRENSRRELEVLTLTRAAVLDAQWFGGLAAEALGHAADLGRWAKFRERMSTEVDVRRQKLETARRNARKAFTVEQQVTQARVNQEQQIGQSLGNAKNGPTGLLQLLRAAEQQAGAAVNYDFQLKIREDPDHALAFGVLSSPQATVTQFDDARFAISRRCQAIQEELAELPQRTSALTQEIDDLVTTAGSLRVITRSVNRVLGYPEGHWTGPEGPKPGMPTAFGGRQSPAGPAAVMARPAVDGQSAVTFKAGDQVLWLSTRTPYPESPVLRAAGAGHQGYQSSESSADLAVAGPVAETFLFRQKADRSWTAVLISPRHVLVHHGLPNREAASAAAEKLVAIRSLMPWF